MNADPATAPAALRRVLLVGSHFPPRGGVGGLRLLKFARYLPEFGWEPVVLTSTVQGEPYLDDTLGAQAAAEVVRTAALSLTPAHTWLRRRVPGAAGRNGRSGRGVRARARWLLVPDEKIGWLPWAVAQGRRLLSSRRFDAILSTSPAATSHLVALLLRAMRPWVADFRDPWSTHAVLYFPTPWHRRVARRLEHKVVATAARVTCTTPAIAAALAHAHADVPPDRFVVLENGFDPEDFVGLVRVPRSRLTFLHAGSFPAFTAGPARNPVVLLDAVAALMTRRPDLRLRVSLELAGPGEEHLRTLVQARRLDGVARVRGFLSHHEALQAMVDADVLVLVGGAAERTSVAAKTFEYLAAGRPILALLPEGENARVCRDAGVPWVVPPDDRGAVEAALEGMIQEGREGMAAPAPLPAALYGRRALTGRLAALLDDLIRVNREAST